MINRTGAICHSVREAMRSNVTRQESCEKKPKTNQSGENSNRLRGGRQG
jgi:hypothetical protein